MQIYTQFETKYVSLICGLQFYATSNELQALTTKFVQCGHIVKHERSLVLWRDLILRGIKWPTHNFSGIWFYNHKSKVYVYQSLVG